MLFTSAAGYTSRPPQPYKLRDIKHTAKVSCGLGWGSFMSLPAPIPAGPAPELHTQFPPHWRTGQPSYTASLPRRFRRPTTVPQTGHSACRGAVPCPETHLRTSPPQPRHWQEDLCPGYHESGDESGDRTSQWRNLYSKTCLSSSLYGTTTRQSPGRVPTLDGDGNCHFRHKTDLFVLWTRETDYGSIKNPNNRSYPSIAKKW